MDLSPAFIRDLEPAVARSLLPTWLGAHVDGPNGLAERVEDAVAAVLSAASDETLRLALHRVADAGEQYRLYDADPLCREVSRAFMPPLVEGAEVDGVDHLRAALRRGPCLLLANHLSYVDTQLSDVLLSGHGAVDLADLLVVVAGPKVYDEAFRRLAATSLSTLKTAQSSQLGSNEAALSPREVGRIAIETIAAAGVLMGEGRPVILYGEGSRSRTGQLGPFLRPVSKYLRDPNVAVVPMAQWGSEQVFPIDGDRLHPGAVGLRFGAAIDSGSPQERVEQSWRAINALLPPRYQAAEGTPPVA
jgi:1-acyl-sn-glycerol-3-phosphate acyltransferase